MAKFLIDLSPEEIDAANEKILHSEDQEEQERLEEMASREAANRLKQIKVWGEIADNFTNEDKS